MKLYSCVLNSVFLSLCLTACGGGGSSNPAPTPNPDPDPDPTPGSFSVGGTISGNVEAVALSLNGNAQSFVSGAFTFTSELDNGAAYEVLLITAGANESCTLQNGSGTIAGAGITNIIVTCEQISAMSLLQYSNTAILGALASGDFNGDGNDDLAFQLRTLDGHPSGADLNFVRFAFGNGAGSFANAFDAATDCDVQLKRGYTMLGEDFNGDGFDDVVCSGGDNTGIKVFAGSAQPDNIFTSGFFQTGSNYFRSLDFNADGLPDIFDLGDGQGSPVVEPNFEYFLNDGANNFGTIQSFAILNDIEASLGQIYSAENFVVGDVNGDMIDDLITMGGTRGLPLNEPLHVAVFTAQAAGGFNLPTSATPVNDIDAAFTINEEFRDLTSGDFNADGHIDIAISHGAEFVNILLGDGLGGFSDQGQITVGRLPLHIATADFNGDSMLDLVTLNQDSHTLHISYGFGDGTFGEESTSPDNVLIIPLDVGINPYDMVIADFDNNALPDIALAESALEIPNVENGNGSVQVFMNPGR
ncbi:MAG: FG-GAP repeat domain-containing protein [Cellvibrionaceae bacterium]